VANLLVDEEALGPSRVVGGLLFRLLAQAITLVCENCLKLLRRVAALPEASRWGGCRYRLPTSPGPEGP